MRQLLNRRTLKRQANEIQMAVLFQGPHLLSGGETVDTHTNIMQFAYVFKRRCVKNMTLSELECRELTQQVCSPCESLK